MIFCVSLMGISQTNSSLFSNNNFPFDHIEFYNSTNGLNGNEVSWMTQDKNGFLWFITDNALNRFDGYTFQSFGYHPNDTNSISTGWYFGLIEDKNGMLWFPDGFRGLHSFNPRRQKFMRYPHQNGIKNSQDYNHIYSMEIEGDSILWIATPAGLDKFDPQSGSYTNYINYKEYPQAPFDLISCIWLDKGDRSGSGSHTVWLATNKGLSSFNTKTGRIEANYNLPFLSHPSQMNGSVNLNGRSKTIWIGSDDNGIYGFNTGNKQFIQIRSRQKCRNPHRHINGSNHQNGYFMVTEDNEGNLWTTNDNNEIVFYDQSKRDFFYLHLPESKVCFLDLPPYIFQDNNQKIWICTATGIIAVDKKKRVFYSFQNEAHNPGSLSGNFICSIYRDKEGSFFASADALDIFNNTSGSFTRFYFKSDEKKINNYGTWDIYEDSKDNLWFAGNYGLYLYNQKSNTSKFLKLRSDSQTVVNGRLIGIIEDNKGRYWATSYGYGLYNFDPISGKTRVFTATNNPNSLSTNDLTTIYKDSKGNLYIGTWQGGLILFDPDTEKFTIYHHDPEDPASVSNESTHLFHETKNGLVWFGTLGGGLNVFNPITQKFKAFTSDDGLAHNSISSIQEDRNGDLWVSTRGGGISRFTPPNDPFSSNCQITFRNFDLSDGLASNQFNMNSSFCDKDGTIYFGSRGAGLIFFHPDSIKENKKGPPIYITDISIHNKQISIGEKDVLDIPIEFTKEIKLNYRQNIISFTFAALNYLHPEKNKYAYMLENYDENWIIVDASKRFANYTNLNPGTYTFKVKASNNDGIWNDTPTELRILISPPFWQTASFKIFIILAILGAVFLVYKYRLHQILKLQKMRNKIAADLHDDIGSTLNSISVYSEVAKKDPGRRDYALSMIGESSRRIIDSMSDIVWTINPQNDSFDKIVFRMKSLTYSLLKAKKIECTFKSDDELNDLNLSMEIRKNFYLIFKEALNNLVKYSEASRASIHVTRENRIITFIIRDNGIGFISDSSNFGNGINNMKRRAAEINGELYIESAPGSGTSVQLNLKA